MKNCIYLALAVLVFFLAACGAPESVNTPPVTTDLNTPAPVTPGAGAAWPPGTSESVQTVLSVPAEAAIEGNVPAKAVMPYYYGMGGEFMGPDDFDVEAGRVYILNTANNTVSVFLDGEMERRAELADAGLRHGVRMAVDGGVIYVFGIEEGSLAPAFAALYPDGTTSALPFMSRLPSEAVSFMSAENGRLYVTASGETLIFDPDDPDTRCERVPAGVHVLGDGTLWRPRVVGEQTFSSVMELDITLPGGESLTLNFEASRADAFLGGLQLLRQGGGQYDVYVVEIALNENYAICTTEYILRVDSSGAPLGVYSGDTSELLYNTRQDAGALYTMSVTDETVDIKRLPDIYPGV